MLFLILILSLLIKDIPSEISLSSINDELQMVVRDFGNPDNFMKINDMSKLTDLIITSSDGSVVNHLQGSKKNLLFRRNIVIMKPKDGFSYSSFSLKQSQCPQNSMNLVQITKLSQQRLSVDSFNQVHIISISNKPGKKTEINIKYALSLSNTKTSNAYSQRNWNIGSMEFDSNVDRRKLLKSITRNTVCPRSNDLNKSWSTSFTGNIYRHSFQFHNTPKKAKAETNKVISNVITNEIKSLENDEIVETLGDEEIGKTCKELHIEDRIKQRKEDINFYSTSVIKVDISDKMSHILTELIFVDSLNIIHLPGKRINLMNERNIALIGYCDGFQLQFSYKALNLRRWQCPNFSHGFIHQFLSRKEPITTSAYDYNDITDPLKYLECCNELDIYKKSRHPEYGERHKYKDFDTILREDIRDYHKQFDHRFDVDVTRDLYHYKDTDDKSSSNLLIDEHGEKAEDFSGISYGNLDDSDIAKPPTSQSEMLSFRISINVNILTDILWMEKSEIVHIQGKVRNWIGRRNIFLSGCLGCGVCYYFSYTNLNVRFWQCPGIPSTSTKALIHHITRSAVPASTEGYGFKNPGFPSNQRKINILERDSNKSYEIFKEVENKSSKSEDHLVCSIRNAERASLDNTCRMVENIKITTTRVLNIKPEMLIKNPNVILGYFDKTMRSWYLILTSNSVAFINEYYNKTISKNAIKSTKFHYNINVNCYFTNEFTGRSVTRKRLTESPNKIDLGIIFVAREVLLELREQIDDNVKTSSIGEDWIHEKDTHVRNQRTVNLLTDQPYKAEEFIEADSSTDPQILATSKNNHSEEIHNKSQTFNRNDSVDKESNDKNIHLFTDEEFQAILDELNRPKYPFKEVFMHNPHDKIKEERYRQYPHERPRGWKPREYLQSTQSRSNGSHLKKDDKKGTSSGHVDSGRYSMKLYTENTCDSKEIEDEKQPVDLEMEDELHPKKINVIEVQYEQIKLLEEIGVTSSRKDDRKLCSKTRFDYLSMKQCCNELTYRPEEKDLTEYERVENQDTLKTLPTAQNDLQKKGQPHINESSEISHTTDEALFKIMSGKDQVKNFDDVFHQTYFEIENDAGESTTITVDDGKMTKIKVKEKKIVANDIHVEMNDKKEDKCMETKEESKSKNDKENIEQLLKRMVEALENHKSYVFLDIDVQFWKHLFHSIADYLVHHEYLSSVAIQTVLMLLLMYRWKQNLAREMILLQQEKQKNIVRLMEQMRRLEVKCDVKPNIVMMPPYPTPANTNKEKHSLNSLNEQQRQQLKKWQDKKKNAEKLGPPSLLEKKLREEAKAFVNTLFPQNQEKLVVSPQIPFPQKTTVKDKSKVAFNLQDHHSEEMRPTTKEKEIINQLFHNPQKQQDVYPLQRQINTRTEAILSHKPNNELVEKPTNNLAKCNTNEKKSLESKSTSPQQHQTASRLTKPYFLWHGYQSETETADKSRNFGFVSSVQKNAVDKSAAVLTTVTANGAVVIGKDAHVQFARGSIEDSTAAVISSEDFNKLDFYC